VNARLRHLLLLTNCIKLKSGILENCSVTREHVDFYEDTYKKTGASEADFIYEIKKIEEKQVVVGKCLKAIEAKIEILKESDKIIIKTPEFIEKKPVKILTKGPMSIVKIPTTKGVLICNIENDVNKILNRPSNIKRDVTVIKSDNDSTVTVETIKNNNSPSNFRRTVTVIKSDNDSTVTVETIKAIKNNSTRNVINQNIQNENEEIIIDIPSTNENVPVENVPSTNENVPVENIPVENVPVENVPVENVPSTNENIPVENIPSTNENVPSTNENVPTGNVDRYAIAPSIT
jgi:hypothetical protein